MELFKELFVNKRGYAFLIPVIMVSAQRLGFIVTDAELGSILDQGTALVSGTLALVSLIMAIRKGTV